jgi:hypothetical protein
VLLRIDACHVGQQNRDIAPPKKGADRPSDICRRQRRRRHLIKQGLEAMVVVPVEDGDVHGSVPQSPRGIEPPKASADDNDLRPCGITLRLIRSSSPIMLGVGCHGAPLPYEKIRWKTRERLERCRKKIDSGRGSVRLTQQVNGDLNPGTHFAYQWRQHSLTNASSESSIEYTCSQQVA